MGLTWCPSTHLLANWLWVMPQLSASCLFWNMMLIDAQLASIMSVPPDRATIVPLTKLCIEHVSAPMSQERHLGMFLFEVPASILMVKSCI